MANPSPIYRFRFGVFEVDPQTSQIWKSGSRVHLQTQPFQLLVTLLEKQGQLVSRDALRHSLWPDGTHVDFEHSLSVAMYKLREVLGDSVEKPRFIETISRHGYCFIAPVETILLNPPTAGLLRLREAFILGLALIICAMVYSLLAFWDHQPAAGSPSGPPGATPRATTPPN
jgi:DNA-binding winged helix-turn-helix (wHTH) protein